MQYPKYTPDSLTIENNTIHIDGYNIQDLAKRFGTPIYILDEQTIINTCRAFKESLQEYYPMSMPIYASKANCSQAVLAIMARENFGLDVVSGGEYYTAKSINFPAEKIFLHGNNKSSEELLTVAQNNGVIILDNFHEIDLLLKLNIPARVLLRVTPGVECHTHEYIRTGQNDSKFGFDINQLDQAIIQLLKHSNINILGLHAHIGSQIFEIEPFCDSARILLDLYRSVKEKHNLEFTHLNLGGGFGMHYTEECTPPSIKNIIKDISNTIINTCKEYSLTLPFLILEPGRSLIARAGVTLYSIGAQKNIANINKSYISVDGGMADNPRPITYQAKYECALIKNANFDKSQTTRQYTVAGRYCESGDILIKQYNLPEDIQTDDLIMLFGTGAYNYSMASNYNRVPKPATILLNNGEAHIIIQAENYEDIIRNDVLPPYLDSNSIQGIKNA